jgi:dihydroorotate dehydrogenase (NAD+) catalytic subunit
LVQTPAGLLNAIGLQNPGIDWYLDHDVKKFAKRPCKIVGSVAGFSVDDYAYVAERLAARDEIHALEVNISCPNVENRGQVFACDALASSRVIGAVRRAADPGQPVFAKLSPDVTDIVHIARACADAGVDGFSLINTLLGMVIDTDTLAPALGGGTGGLSGPAIRPVAVRCVWQVRAALPRLPIIGMGGIRTGLDALQFVLAGASAVEVGTAVFGDPSAPMRVLAELSSALDERGFASLADAVGYAQRSAHERTGLLAPVAAEAAAS